jgi:hypothetical protein
LVGVLDPVSGQCAVSCGLPAISSAELARALRRLGAEPRREASGSHQMWQRRMGNRLIKRPIVIGKRQVTHGVIRDVIAAFGISEDELRGAL